MPEFYKKNSATVLSKKIRFFAVLFITSLLSLKSFAVVYNVTNTTDGLALNQLRGAILAADAAGPGPHTINVAAGTYTLTLGQITFGNNPQTINIIGAGAATTIIQMTGPIASRDRIFFINPSGTTNSPIISVSGITFQGAYLNSDPYGGAAICAGGGSAESLTVTNCIFDSNTLPANAYGGAAVCMQVRGDLTINNCTFTNNVSNDADGGAVLFIPYNSGLGNGQGNLSVTNSTFTNNSVVFPGLPTSNGGALAFTGPGGAVYHNVTINNNTFTNNTADGLGGAISANNSPNLSISQIHYNRFVNNTSSASPLSSGLHFVESSGSVNAENNWWGCNTNPVSGASTAPCNQAGGDVAGGGALDANPWLQLRTTASPTTICNSTPTTLGNTSAITTSILNNSDGTAIPVANLNRLIGLPVTWTSTLGSLSAQQVTIQAAGTATATFTSNGTAGTATVNAQIDNVPSSETTPARASITVNATSIAPTGATGTTTVCSGGATTLTVSGGLKGTGAVTQWFTGSCGGTLVFTGDAFSTGALVATTTYFVRYNGTCNTTTCATVTVNVNDVTGGTVGTDQTVCSGGDPALFTESVASTGSGALTYQWQSSTTSCAAGFSNIAGATGTTYDAPSGVAITTFYRRVTTSTLNTIPCTANSNCITVTVNNVTGGTVAADQTICSGGDPAAFTQTVASTGSGVLTYQWQSSTTSCAAGFSDIGGATGTTYDAPAGVTVTTYYRRVTTSTLSGVPCTANSNCITVSVNDITGGTVGSDQSICSGGNPALFTQSVASTGSGVLTYQWQSSTTSCAAGFSNIGGATATTYDPPAGLTQTTYYRRVTTSTLNAVACTANSNCITVTINPATITVTNPATTTGFANAPFSQTFTASGGIAPYTFTTASPLPTGLTLSAAGVLSGTPTVTGTFNITVTATDAGGCIGTGANYPLVISANACPAGIVSQLGSAASNTATSAYGPNTISGFTAPAGTNRLLVVTASDAGATTVTGVTFGSTPMVKQTETTDGFAVDAVFTLALGSNASPTTDNIVMTGGSADKFITATVFQNVNQATPVSGIQTANNILVPSVSTLTIPSAVNDMVFDIFDYFHNPTVANSAVFGAGQTPIINQGPLTITSGTGGFGYYSTSRKIGAASVPMIRTTADGQALIHIAFNIKAGATTITVTNPVVTTGSIGVPFSQTFTASGGLAPYTFTTFSALPAGLTLSSAGVLSGTPTATGTFPITVSATDANGCFGNGATYNLVISACSPSSITLGASPTVCRGTTTASLPYTATTGTPDTYSIDYDAAANTAGFVDVVNAPLPVSPIILTIPGAAAAATYNATITVIKTVGGCISPAVPFTVTVSALPTTANAGTDKTACVSPGSATMTATAPATGTGVWTQVAGPSTATIVNATSPTTNIINLAGIGTYTFRWTVTNAPCPASFDDVDVVVNGNPVPFILAGGGTFCPGTTTLTGPANPNYTYNWERSLSGIANPNSFTAFGGTAQTQAVTTSGNYRVIVTNQFGCTASDTASVSMADYVFNGSLAAGDATQTGRLNRFGVVSTCAAPKACPGTFTTTGARLYDSYTITNPRSVPVCATIGIASGCGVNMFSVAYTGSYNPTALCTNYLADPGSSFPNAGYYEATIPANGSIVVIVHEVNTGTGCLNYQLTVDVPRDLSAINAAPPSVVCNGTSTLTAPVAGSYLWSPGGATTQSMVTPPLFVPTKFYATMGYGNAGCTRLDSVTVGVTSLPPTVSCPGNISLNNTPGICGRAVTYTTTVGGLPAPTVTYSFTGATTGSGAGDGSGSTFNVGITNVTVTVTNSCGSANCSFTVTITDNQPPTVTTGTIGSCYPTVAAAQAAALAATSATDNCPGALTETASTVGSCSAVVTVRTTDAAGNFTDVTYNTRIDNTAPTVTVGTIGSCYPTVAAAQAAALAATSATDNCPGALTEVASTVGTCSAVITVTTTDGCGNATSVTYSTRIDNTAPTVTVGTIASCYLTVAQAEAAALAATTATDNCPGALTETASTLGTCSAVVTVTFTDACGNATSVTYNTRIDNTPPTLTCPGPVTVCGQAAVPAADILLVTGLTDNCPGAITVTWQGDAGTPSATTPYTITRTYRATDGCGNYNECTQIITVNPIPNATATPSSQSICSGSAITTIVLTGNVAGTVYNWTRDNTGSVTGIAATGAGNISGSLTNTTNAPVTVTFTITPSFTNAGVTCTGTPITASVVVKPIPNAVATPSAQTICSGSIIANIILSGNVAGTSFSWSRDNTVAVTGIAASGTGDIGGSLTNTTNAPVTVTFTITPTANGCTGPSITATVVVNPIPNAVATPASQTICSANAITTIVLSGNVSGTVYNWTRNNTGTVTGIAASGSGNISGILINTTNAPVTVTFTITPSYTNAGVTCTGAPITATVLVNPTPNAVATPASQTICSASAITTIVMTGNVSGTTYTWTRDNTVAVTGIAASGSGNISGSLTNTTNAPITVTFTITPTANGCPGPSVTATVVVNPIPNAVASPTSQTICSGNAITTIALTGNVAGTVFNWTRDNTTTVTGIANNGSGNISGSLTNNTTAPITVTFTITPTANGCPGPTTTATVLVNPTPNASVNPVNQTICSGSTITTIAISGAVSGTTFNWTRDNTAAVTGIAASGTGNISGALTNTTNAPVSVTFTITPIANGCTGASVTAVVIVNPTPNAVATPSSQTICSGSAITTIVLSGNVSGTVFNWSRDNVFAVTGMPNGGTGNISGSLTNTTNAPVTVTFTITPSYTNGGVTCTGTPITATVLVNPTPNAVATPASQTICSESNIIPIVLSGSVSGTTFNWTRNNTGTVTGIAASGSGNISGQLINTTNAPVTVTFTITPIANGCPGTPITATVLVNPTPNAVATPQNQTICSGNAITPIILTGNVSGTTYSWIRDNTTTVAGIPASGSGNISGSLTNNTTAQINVTFIITPTANGCQGPSINAIVVVNPSPTISCPANIVVNAAAGTCGAIVNYPAATATGTPAPTITYSIPAGSTFPVGVTTVTATATNVCGTVSCTFTITVLDVRVPVITTQPINRAVCVGGNTAFSVVATNAASYQWQTGNANNQWGNIPGATSATFNVNNAPLSLNGANYRVAITGPCGTIVYSNTVVLTVNPLPTITLTSSTTPVLVPGRRVVILTRPDPPGGTFAWLFNGAPITGATGPTLGPLTVDNIGRYNVIYTDLNGCVNTSSDFLVTGEYSITFWVYPNPTSDGRFQVRFNNHNGEVAKVRVYDPLGQVVYQQKVTTGPTTYTRIDVDLSNAANGIYTVELLNGSDLRVGAKQVLIAR